MTDEIDSDANNTHELTAEVARALIARGWRLTTAESCTGGNLAAALCAQADTAAFYDTGVVTFSDEAKRNVLPDLHRGKLVDVVRIVGQHLFCGPLLTGNGGFDCFIVQQLFLSVHPDTPVRLIFSMIPYLGVWSQRNRRFSAGKFYAFRAALWRG